MKRLVIEDLVYDGRCWAWQFREYIQAKSARGFKLANKHLNRDPRVRVRVA